MNLVRDILSQATPHAPAMHAGDRTWTYQDLADEAFQILDHLKSQGLPSQTLHQTPRIGLIGLDGPQYVLAALAIGLSGSCLVPVPHELTAHEQENLIQTTALHALVTLESHDFKEIRVTLLPPPTSKAFQEDQFHALNPLFIRFSSGTTGKSKGVILSHETLRARLQNANCALQLTPDDRILWTLPMAHHFAVSLMLYLYTGASFVLAGKTLASDLLQVARRYSATLFYGSPYHLTLLSAEKSDLDWPTLRQAIGTAAPLPQETAHQFQKRYGIGIRQALGIIEAGLPLMDSPSPPGISTLGHPVGNFEIRIHQPDELGVGELHLKGPGIADAYLSPWAQRSEFTEHGWFATGDLVRRRDDGRIEFMGRKKSVINVGGMKVFPEEIEQILVKHPEVAQVRVIPREHPLTGQIPVAEIIPISTDSPPKMASLIQFLRPQIASYKMPVKFDFVTQLPLTASGKIKR